MPDAAPGRPRPPLDADPRTVVQHGPSMGASARPAPDVARAQEEPLSPRARQVGDNVLLSLVQPLLAVSAQLRALPFHAEPARLREDLSRSVSAFEPEARALGIAEDRIVAGRYVACACIDEAASSTPWGGSGQWAKDPLLVRFAGESWGGDRVFQLLDKLLEDPARNRDLLEVILAALALGFEGRYRVGATLDAGLEGVIERLVAVLERDRGGPDPRLSPGLSPVRIATDDRSAITLVAVVASAAALALTVVYALLADRLAAGTNAAYAAVAGVQVPRDRPVPAPAVSTPTAPVLAALLELERRQGLVEVREEVGRSVITLRGDGMFEPGRADPGARVVPVIDRIGKALAEREGPVLITGHTDNVPVGPGRFRSNWHLSEERALAVRGILARHLPAERLRAEGMADRQPADARGPAEDVARANDTPDKRARNRRVEITLLARGRAPEAAPSRSVR